MNVSVRMLWLFALVAFLYVTGYTRPLIHAQEHEDRAEQPSFFGRPSLSTSHQEPEMVAPDTHQGDVPVTKEEDIDEEEFVGTGRIHHTRSRTGSQVSRRSITKEDYARTPLNVGNYTAIILVATSALVSWIILTRLFRTTLQTAKEPPGEAELAEGQEVPAAIIPEAPLTPEVETTGQAEQAGAKEKINTLMSQALGAHLRALLLALLIVSPLLVDPKRSAELLKTLGDVVANYPLQAALASLGIVLGELYWKRKMKQTEPEHEMDWVSTAEIFVHHTAPQDRANLKMRLGQALQLIAGAEEQAQQGLPESLLHVHPLQLRDFRIGSYATALWMAAAARVGRISLTHEDRNLQREMRRALELSDALRRLSFVSPVAGSQLDLTVPPYKLNWRGQLVLPRIKKQDLTDLINLTSRIYMMLPE